MSRLINVPQTILALVALCLSAACNNANLSSAPPDMLVSASPGVHAPFPVPENLENARGLPSAEEAVALPSVDVANAPAGVLITDLPSPVSAAETSDVVLSLSVGAGLYREIAVEFSTPDGQVFERQHRDVGSHRQRATRMKFSMPVSGTWAASPERQGTWNAQVFLDGVAVAARTFEVQP